MKMASTHLAISISLSHRSWAFMIPGECIAREIGVLLADRVCLHAVNTPELLVNIHPDVADVESRRYRVCATQSASMNELINEQQATSSSLPKAPALVRAMCLKLYFMMG